jgi:hypothetical protein
MDDNSTINRGDWAEHLVYDNNRNNIIFFTDDETYTNTLIMMRADTGERVIMAR